MDAVTIVAIAGQLVVLCSNLSHTFQQVIKGSDARIQLLFQEVASLSEVLNSIRSMKTFSNPGMDEYWPQLVRSMKDCEDTLQGLERILEALKQSKHGLLGRVKRQIKWEAKSIDISLARQRIASHRQAMSLTLQLMTVYVIPKVSFLMFTDPHFSQLIP